MSALECIDISWTILFLRTINGYSRELKFILIHMLYEGTKTKYLLLFQITSFVRRKQKEKTDIKRGHKESIHTVAQKTKTSFYLFIFFLKNRKANSAKKNETKAPSIAIF